MEFTGRIRFIDPVKDSSATTDREFLTRTFGVIYEDEINGDVREVKAGFQALGERTKLLDSVNVGDSVKVTYGLSGTLKSKKDTVEGTEKNPNSEVIFTNLNLIRIEVLEKATQPVSAPVQKSENTTDTAKTETPIADDDLPF